MVAGRGSGRTCVPQVATAGRSVGESGVGSLLISSHSPRGFDFNDLTSLPFREVHRPFPRAETDAVSARLRSDRGSKRAFPVPGLAARKLRDFEEAISAANSAVSGDVMRNSPLAVPSLLHQPTEALGWPTRRRDITLAALGGTMVHGLVYFLANHYPFGTVRQLELTAFDLAVPYLVANRLRPLPLPHR